jgi:hypothetical protein
VKQKYQGSKKIQAPKQKANLLPTQLLRLFEILLYHLHFLLQVLDLSMIVIKNLQ